MKLLFLRKPKNKQSIDDISRGGGACKQDRTLTVLATVPKDKPASATSAEAAPGKETKENIPASALRNKSSTKKKKKKKVSRKKQSKDAAPMTKKKVWEVDAADEGSKKKKKKKTTKEASILKPSTHTTTTDASKETSIKPSTTTNGASKKKVKKSKVKGGAAEQKSPSTNSKPNKEVGKEDETEDVPFPDASVTIQDEQRPGPAATTRKGRGDEKRNGKATKKQPRRIRSTNNKKKSSHDNMSVDTFASPNPSVDANNLASPAMSTKSVNTIKVDNRKKTKAKTPTNKKAAAPVPAPVPEPDPEPVPAPVKAPPASSQSQNLLPEFDAWCPAMEKTESLLADEQDGSDFVEVDDNVDVVVDDEPEKEGWVSYFSNLLKGEMGDSTSLDTTTLTTLHSINDDTTARGSTSTDDDDDDDETLETFPGYSSSYSASYTGTMASSTTGGTVSTDGCSRTTGTSASTYGTASTGTSGSYFSAETDDSSAKVMFNIPEGNDDDSSIMPPPPPPPPVLAPPRTASRFSSPFKLDKMKTRSNSPGLDLIKSISTRDRSRTTSPALGMDMNLKSASGQRRAHTPPLHDSKESSLAPHPSHIMRRARSSTPPLSMMKLTSKNGGSVKKPKESKSVKSSPSAPGRSSPFGSKGGRSSVGSASRSKGGRSSVGSATKRLGRRTASPGLFDKMLALKAARSATPTSDINNEEGADSSKPRIVPHEPSPPPQHQEDVLSIDAVIVKAEQELMSVEMTPKIPKCNVIEDDTSDGVELSVSPSTKKEEAREDDNHTSLPDVFMDAEESEQREDIDDCDGISIGTDALMMEAQDLLDEGIAGQ